MDMQNCHFWRLFYQTVILRAHGTCSKLADTPIHPSRDDVMCKPVGWHGEGIPSHSQHLRSRNPFTRPTPQLVCLPFWLTLEITSESVANGFALQIVASKRASGKTIRRFWVFVFSSRAMQLQTSSVLSDLCAFNRSTSSPSNPTHVRITPASSSRIKSTCTTRSAPRRGRTVKSQT